MLPGRNNERFAVFTGPDIDAAMLEVEETSVPATTTLSAVAFAGPATRSEAATTIAAPVARSARKRVNLKPVTCIL
ncbi:hypothetical protein GCM10025863_14080 [Microbacterium suwonense]|uniref:Uncharacterized protein n=1 Tax=Microbacterium suwonense TaxID=683047 RepID=A0ABN6X271_9MICO|nr:hypothetical protein GCM10025863_14080 [Microbacterium suwonense]